MAITVNALSKTGSSQSHLSAITPWFVNATSADASDCEEIIAAPGAGYALVVERLQIHIGDAITVTVGSGETGPGSVEGDKIGPLGGAVGTFILDFRDRPVQLTTNKSLTIDSSAGGTVCVIAEGFTKAV